MSGQVPEEASISATLKSGSHPLPPAVDPTRLPHLPGLDGLRGLAVIGAILFHSGFSWAKGGFLGVSTFFVLSGFLITNLLIREWDTTGTIRLKRFWARRFRRLLPAALLTLLLVALIWTRLGTAEQIADLRYDTLAALAYVANWRFYLDGTSYAEVFGAPSPLQHFWSLAIEEQFYLLFPPAVLVVMEIGGRRLLASSLCAAIAVSIGLVFILGTQIDRIYYGTDTRAAELLAGALFALWWTRPHTVRSGRNARQTTGSNTAGDVVGLGAMAAMFCAWWSVSHTSELLSYGGLPLYAILTTIIIHAAIQPGRVARLLSLSPLRWIGLISYGLYLYHWPVFLILDEQRLGLGAAPLFVVQMTVTTLIAVASYFLLEMPIRRGRLFQTDRAVYGAAFSGAIVVAICAVFVTRNPPTVTIPYADVRLEDFSSAIKAKVVEQSTGTTASTTDRQEPGW